MSTNRKIQNQCERNCFIVLDSNNLLMNWILSNIFEITVRSNDMRKTALRTIEDLSMTRFLNEGAKLQ